jgi:flagellin
VSIFLRPASAVALAVLRSTQSSLNRTQQQASSGLRVAGAKDNAAYWHIATVTRSDTLALSAVRDALGMAAATVNIASTSITNAADLVSQIKSKLVAATEDGVDKVKVNEDIAQLKDQLRSVGEAASFNGDNWVVLDGNDDPNKPKEIPASLIRYSDGTISMGWLTYKGDAPPSGTITPEDAGYLIDDLASGTGGHGVLTSDAFATAVGASQNYVLLASKNGNTAGQVEISLDSTTTQGQVRDMLSVVDAMLGQLTTIGSAFGSMETRVQLQQNFAQDLSDSLTEGVGKLVDADMEEVSTRLAALQTRQQLGLQSLSIANASYDTIRQLFQNIH